MATNKHRGTCIIDIGKKKRGIVFNMNTYAIFCEGMNIDLSDIDKVFGGKSQTKALCWLIYAGCVAYDEKNSKDVDYNIHDFYDWCMNLSAEDTQKVMDTMIGSRELGNDSNNGMARNVIESTKDDVKKN